MHSSLHHCRFQYLIFFAASHLIRQSIKVQAIKAAVLSQLISSFLDRGNFMPTSLLQLMVLWRFSEKRRENCKQQLFLKAFLSVSPLHLQQAPSPAFTDIFTSILGHSSLYKVIAIALKQGQSADCEQQRRFRSSLVSLLILVQITVV